MQRFEWFISAVCCLLLNCIILFVAIRYFLSGQLALLPSDAFGTSGYLAVPLILLLGLGPLFAGGFFYKRPSTGFAGTTWGGSIGIDKIVTD